jgi:DNA-binding PadR family transcriptional regulator
MERRRWLESEWGLNDQNRRVKHYALTPAGRRALTAQTDQWQRYVLAVSKVLTAA